VEGGEIMSEKLFIAGLPGSGKSTVADLISMFARDKHWSTNHISDYALLYKMYQQDKKGQFSSTGFGGFDVLDLDVYDNALKQLEQEVNQMSSSAKSEELILIEFSRNNYWQAFHQFSKEFLVDAYFLYLSVDIETCRKRICERTLHPTTSEDHYVSDFAFRTYYLEDDGADIPQILEEDYGIARQRSLIIENIGLLQEVTPSIKTFVDLVIARDLHFEVASPCSIH